MKMQFKKIAAYVLNLMDYNSRHDKVLKMKHTNNYQT